VKYQFAVYGSTLQTQTSQAIFELCDLEIDQESFLYPRKFHVRNQLSLVNALKLIYTL